MNRRTTTIAVALGVAGLAALIRPVVLPESRPAPRPALDTAWTALATPRGLDEALGDRAILVASPPAVPVRPRAEPSAVPGPVVYVVGAVRRPGVYALAAGARLVSAVRAAGGFADSADRVAIDLAAFARDGARIVVPKVGDAAVAVVGASAPLQDGGEALQDGTEPPAEPAASGGVEADALPRVRHRTRRRGHRRRRRTIAVEDAGSASATDGTPDTGAPGAGAPPVAPVDINTADASELETLPGIGPALAERIVEFRTISGPFDRPEQLLDVNGMTDARYAAIAGLFTAGRSR